MDSEEQSSEAVNNETVNNEAVNNETVNNEAVNNEAVNNEAVNTEMVCSVCSKVAKHKCSRCSNERYCSTGCQKEHWPTHKTQCKKKKVAVADPLPESAATKEEGPCGMCTKSTNTKCSNCHQVYYCKRLCQQKHWPQHKSQCHPFKIKENDKIGRYLVASRPLKAGEVILKEEPLVVGPLEQTNMACLGCYKVIDGTYRCRQCSWPLCGPACEESLDHKAECEMCRPAMKTVAGLDKSAVAAILPLRCLALKENEDKYKTFLKLQDRMGDLRKQNKKKMQLQKFVIDVLKKKLNLKYKPSDKKDTLESILISTLGVIDINAFEIFSETSADTMGIFYLAAMMEHSCTPNTRYKFNSSRHIILKAAVDIAEGEHITNTYTKILSGTAERRRDIFENKFFHCECKRCTDPTEFGTYFSALKCQKCYPGYLLPTNSLNANSDWTCNECKANIKSVEACSKTNELGEQVKEIMKKPAQESLDKFLSENIGKTVHCNHFHLLLVRHTLMQLYGRGPTALKDDILKKKEKLCQDILDMLSKFDPNHARVSTYTGVIFFEYHDVAMVRANRLANIDYPDVKKIDQCISLSKLFLQKCIKVLQDESEEMPEGKLRIFAQKKLSEVCLLTSKNIS